MPSDRGQACDKVHADLLKWKGLGLGGDSVKWGSSGMSKGFVLLADGAPFDVICHPLFHSRPLGVLAGLPEGLVSSRVSGGGVVMVDGHQCTFFEGSQVSLDPVNPKPRFWD